jgi:hypothetical protein
MNLLIVAPIFTLPVLSRAQNEIVISEKIDSVQSKILLKIEN